MHDTAMEIGCLVMNRYSDLPRAKVLELGSYEINGSLRSHAPKTTEYVGIDLEAGPGVDFVVEPGKPWPLEDNYFDLVLASSVFEHDPMFWATFLQMVRKVRRGGYIYVSAPSNGAVHRYPEDHWRFYPDSGLALERWACSQGEPVVLVESFTAGRKADHWNDFVAIFRKGKSKQSLPTKFIYEEITTFNAIAWNHKEPVNASDMTEDMLLIEQAHAQIGELNKRVEVLDWENRANWEERQKAESELLLIGARLSQEQAGHEASRKQIIELSAGLERQRIDFEAAAATVATLQAELASCTAELAAAEEACTGLKAEVEEREASLRSTAEELAQLQERHALSVSILLQREEEIEQTRSELDRVRSEHLLALEEKEKLQARLREADSWTFKLAGDRKHWEMQAQRAARALDQLQAELGVEARRLTEKLGRSEADLRAERAAKSQVEAELAASLAEKEELTRALDQLHAELGVEARHLSEKLGSSEADLRAERAAKLQVEAELAANHAATEELTRALELVEAALGEREAALQAAMHARQESEQKLAARFNEVAQLTSILAQEGNWRAAFTSDNDWLRDMVMTAARMPKWWSWLPTRWRRSREHAFYRRAGLFDAARYLEIHPDVAQDGMDPVRHYIMHGMSEGRERPH